MTNGSFSTGTGKASERPIHFGEDGSDLGYRVWSSIDDVPASDWDPVCEEGGRVFMDRRFIRAVERSMGAVSRFWHVVFYDASGRPVACACLSTFQADPAGIAVPSIQRLLRRVRRWKPSFLCVTIFFCGLPVSGTENQLVVSPEADAGQVLRVLDSVMQRLAAEAGARLIGYKEFAEGDRERLDVLLELGYLRGPSLPVNRLSRSFADFDEYCAALRRPYRWEIKQSLRKFGERGYAVTRIEDGAEIARRCTERLHRLYLAVVANSESRLEILPAAFFQELALQMPEDVCLTLVSRDERTVAFLISLKAPASYHFLFCGLDYAANEEDEVYFNLMYQGLDHGLQAGRPVIVVGQTADHFKARLGCESHPRWIYARARGSVLGSGLRWVFPFVFPTRDAPAPRRVFRDEVPS